MDSIVLTHTESGEDLLISMHLNLYVIALKLAGFHPGVIARGGKMMCMEPCAPRGYGGMWYAPPGNFAICMV